MTPKTLHATAALLAIATAASALELTLTPTGVSAKSAAPIGTVRLSYPKLTGDGDRAPKVTSLADREAVLEYPSGTTLILTLGPDGAITLTPKGAVAAKDKGISHSATFPLSYGTDGVHWTVEDRDARPFPATKPDDAFFFRGDAKKLRIATAEGAGVAIGLPYGYMQLQDNRQWNTKNFQWVSHSHFPTDGSTYTYTVTDAGGEAVAIGKAPALDPYEYVPYPEAKESLWPGKGPIRTFGWQDGIRRKYNANRLKDENAVMFIGDSLTENWKTLEKDFLGIKVANRGVGGDTSRGALFRFPLEVVAHKPAAVAILAGANDLTAHGDPENTLSNLLAMVRQARAYNGKMPVFLATIPPSSQPNAPLKPGALDHLNNGIRKLAAETKCTLVDLHNACLLPDGTQNLDLFAKDRLHLGAQGYVVWRSLMAPLLTNDALAGRTTPTPVKKIDLAQFELVWQDEFDGAALDPAKWDSPRQQRQGASLWHERNVSVADGVAKFDIRRTTDAKYRYESACIRSRRDYKEDLFTYRYGYVEARCRLPRHVRSDYWVGFWLLAGNVLKGADDDTRNGSEIDILETFDLWNLGATKHTVHWGGYGKRHNAYGVSSGPKLETLNDDYHTFGLYWDEERYIFYVDGQEVWDTDFVGFGSEKDGKRKSLGTCREPAYIKMSVEAAPWCGPSNLWEPEMPESDDLLVDYIRVYQKKP